MTDVCRSCSATPTGDCADVEQQFVRPAGDAPVTAVCTPAVKWRGPVSSVARRSCPENERSVFAVCAVDK